ncbi:MAG: glycosyltransferase family 8 protein [Rickettsiales bacterium]|jgi:lipopolysaccharide biosynthesis glycosyltransferase|nr:glycosyltransferase family 8 protein [Rickettsiales bacterium]
MTKEIISVALACDDNYAHYCAETIVSILINTKCENIHYNFYIIQKDLSEKNKTRIEKLRKTIGDCSIEFLDIRSTAIITGNPMFYRLCLASLLPKKLNKVIYTDCDVTFLDDLRELWHEDIDDYYSGNCVDWGYNKDRTIDHFLNNCNISESELFPEDHEMYFNSGLMILNLAKIREDDIEKKSIDFAEKYPNLPFKDQDIINLVYHGKIKTISFKWSFLISYYAAKKHGIRIDNEALLHDLKKSAKNPKMVHFLANKKPTTVYRSIFHFFSYRIVNRYKMLFWKYLALTDWKGENKYKIVHKFPLNFLNLLGK